MFILLRILSIGFTGTKGTSEGVFYVVLPLCAESIIVAGLLLFKTVNDEICTHPYTFAGLQTQKGKLPSHRVGERKAIKEN